MMDRMDRMDGMDGMNGKEWCVGMEYNGLVLYLYEIEGIHF